MSIDFETSSNVPQQSRRKFKYLPIVLFLVFGIYYYYSHNEVNPYTGRTQLIGLNPDQEMALGFQSYQQVLQTEDVMEAGPEVSLVRKVGERIAAASENSTFQWEFNVIRSNQENAFCLPGGKVAVYSGILPIAQNENGLAVVMGHEISHALARHGAERMAQEQLAQFGQIAMGMATNEMDTRTRQVVMGAFGIGSQFGVLLPFSRSHETEADVVGLKLMAKACFNPSEAPKFWQRMSEMKNGAGGAPAEFMSTHPSDETRIRNLEEMLPEAMQIYNESCQSKNS